MAMKIPMPIHLMIFGNATRNPMKSQKVNQSNGIARRMAPVISNAVVFIPKSYASFAVMSTKQKAHI
jgi:hypothetical protein